MKYILPALISNAATLGVHWIYDYQFLTNLSNKQSLLFMSQDKLIYDQANPSYYAYPNSQIGDLSVQGLILKWLYQALSSNSEFDQNDYADLLFEQFKPGGTYHGYVETYAKKLVIKKLSESLKFDSSEILINDDHLVGFIPYLVSKELGFSYEKAWSFTRVLTDNVDYLSYFKMFDSIFNRLTNSSLKDALKVSIKLAPISAQKSLEKAIELSDTNPFIADFASRACSIKDAIPVIIHILYHSNSFEDAIAKNASIGGASSDRGLILGPILNQVYEIPEKWIELVSKKISI